MSHEPIFSLGGTALSPPSIIQPVDGTSGVERNDNGTMEFNGNGKVADVNDHGQNHGVDNGVVKTEEQVIVIVLNLVFV